MNQIKSGSKAKQRKVKEVSSLLSQIYGPIPWEPRYNAAEELVYTILSQHTSDINSERAFLNLMKVFGDLDSIANASIEKIELAIRRGGLSKTKAPRIKSIGKNQFHVDAGISIDDLKDQIGTLLSILLKKNSEVNSEENETSETNFETSAKAS